MAAEPVVAGVDGSPESMQAVGWAAREAALRGTSLRIVAVASMPPRMRPNPATPDTVAGRIVQGAARALAAAATQAGKDAPGLSIETQLLDGVSPDRAFVEAGKEALMLVLGSRGAGGFSALVLGSVSRYAATNAVCPVVVVRDETTTAHCEIVVGVEDPAQAAAALGFAFEEAALRKAKLTAVHAWSRVPFGGHDEPPDEAKRTLDALLDGWRGKYPDVAASAEIMHAHPGKVLAGASARADLVVLGRRAPGERQGVGSVTHSVLTHANGPVVTVPGE
jgi:nucleotide-binding universal stress UspA family protein